MTRLYDYLFTALQPGVSDAPLLQELNARSLQTVSAYVEPSLASAQPDEKFQFERHGYFVADRLDHRAEAPIFNRTTGLKDTWSK